MILPDTIQVIGDYAFSGCTGITAIEIPNNVEEIRKGVFANCSNLESITVYEGNENYKSIDGGLDSKDGSLLLHHASPTKEKSFTVPDYVTSIGSKAFSTCDYLNEIVFSNKVAIFDEEAFFDCPNLKKVNYIGTMDEWIERGLGRYFDHAYYLYINNELVSNVEIKNVERIMDKAFAWCNSLTEIKISNKVKRKSRNFARFNA